jgi:hypothetical protein
VSRGALFVPVAQEAHVRLARVMGISGPVQTSPVNRRFRGKKTDTYFGGQDETMLTLSGVGSAMIDVQDIHLTTLILEQEGLYARETSVLAFSGGIVWENGRLPNPNGEDLDIVHLSGKGQVSLMGPQPHGVIRVSKTTPAWVRLDNLVAWNGQMVPAQKDLEGLPGNVQSPGMVRFEGEGLVIIAVED